MVHTTAQVRTEEAGAAAVPGSQDLSNLELQARVTGYSHLQGSPHKFIKPHSRDR